MIRGREIQGYNLTVNDETGEVVISSSLDEKEGPCVIRMRGLAELDRFRTIIEEAYRLLGETLPNSYRIVVHKGDEE